jgi:5-methylcytosine-specific restriction enzyme A
MTAKHPFSTRRGRKLRQAKLNADPLCEPCQREDRVSSASQVHHIKPLNEGGDPWLWSNFESDCDDHHKQRHGGKPKVDVDPATGLPLGDHWRNE